MDSFPQTQPVNASWRSVSPATHDKYAGSSSFKTQPSTLSSTPTTRLAPVAFESPSPRVSGTNANAPLNALGLSLLSRLDDEYFTTTGADIIAIHGINGHAYYTWTADGNDGPLWLRDFLPHEIPGARIYSFGYDFKILFSKANGDLASISRSFLAQLVATRGERLRHRPLVFLCHSTGGIVLKQALIQARLDEYDYPGIKESTKAIIFLSTPHRGFGSVTWPLLLANVINASLTAGPRLWGRTQTDLLKSLERDSDGLHEISVNFRNQAAGIRIVSCYEQNVTPPLNELVVNEYTGVLGFPGEKLVPMMGCDHLSIANFASRDDANYKLIVHEIKEAVKSVNAGNSHGKSALFEAVAAGNKAEVQLLLERKADINARDKRGRTVLMYACEGRLLALVEILCNAGADVNLKDKLGWTALMIAVRAGGDKVTRLLLDSRADITWQNSEGHGAIFYAVHRQNGGVEMTAQERSVVTLLFEQYKKVVVTGWDPEWTACQQFFLAAEKSNGTRTEVTPGSRRNIVLKKPIELIPGGVQSREFVPRALVPVGNTMSATIQAPQPDPTRGENISGACVPDPERNGSFTGCPSWTGGNKPI